MAIDSHEPRRVLYLRGYAIYLSGWKMNSNIVDPSTWRLILVLNHVKTGGTLIWGFFTMAPIQEPKHLAHSEHGSQNPVALRNFPLSLLSDFTLGSRWV